MARWKTAPQPEPDVVEEPPAEQGLPLPEFPEMGAFQVVWFEVPVAAVLLPVGLFGLFLVFRYAKWRAARRRPGARIEQHAPDRADVPPGGS